MKVSPNTVVTLDFTVANASGEVLDSTEGKQPLQYLHGTGYLVAGLETVLENKLAGEDFEVTLTPEQAYGEYDESLVQSVPGEMFDGMEVSEGDTFVAETDDGHRPVTIVEVAEEYVKVDGNHPLAGMTLSFKGVVREVRAATEEELAHGHVHGEHDHDHDHHHEGGCCGHHH
ncbi:peptidylprolyl isomerase [Zobellella taiwanensis]|jgi:FKBP-type peptidyl-prolyl cis-trans isomerase SlyD|uniref:Peptidyl-prolyl cis-trans isomerase n=1 Tax=Zobellella taiwanensis TaxID=347535 RepID=A0A2P7QL79_9GAMM|nr:peptidylprolyl isomerase [Zobellella taiwanensis]PSJ38727.1 peptidylprolyl isomerase [Zobellella taiwanensis]